MAIASTLTISYEGITFIQWKRLTIVFLLAQILSIFLPYIASY